MEILIRLSHYFRVSTDYLLGVSDSNGYDFSGLTDEQAVLVNELIRQFEQANARK